MAHSSAIRRFFTGSVRRTLASILVLATLLPICVICVIFFDNLRGKSIEDYRLSNERMIRQVALYMDQFFGQIDDIGLDIYRDNAFFSNLKGSSAQFSGIYREQYNASCIRSYFLKSQDIWSIKYRSLLDGSVMQHSMKATLSENYILGVGSNKYFDEIYSEPDNLDFENDSVFTLLRGENAVFLTYCRLIFAIPNKDPIGYFSIIMGMDSLRTACESFLTQPEEVLLLYSEHTDEFFYSGAESDGLHSAVLEYSAEQPLPEYLMVDGERWMIFAADVPDFRLRVYKAIPYDAVTRDITLAALEVLLFCALTGVVALLLVGLLSRSVTKPLHNLQLAITRVRCGDYGRPVPCAESGGNEIFDAIREFNRMSEEINTLIHEKLYYRIDIQQAQLRALQAAINPHFITNTVQAISLMAVKRNAYDIKYMMDAFCGVMRYAIDGEHRLATVRDEMDHVTQYLILQKLRLGDRLDFTVRCEDSAAAVLIPKISVQPLVENVVQHGFRIPDQCVSVHVSAEFADGELILRVEDDGAGFSIDIAQFLESLDSDSPEISRQGLHGIGISNVNSRMKLTFPGRYRLEITSSPGSKTCVIMRIRTEEYS